MKNFIGFILNYITKNPRTTLGAMITLMGMVLWIWGKINTGDFVLVLGITSVMIGVTAQDQKH